MTGDGGSSAEPPVTTPQQPALVAPSDSTLRQSIPAPQGEGNQGGQLSTSPPSTRGGRKVVILVMGGAAGLVILIVVAFCLARSSSPSHTLSPPGHLKQFTRVRANQDEALQSIRKAAEQGNADAQNDLGVCYETGDGMGRDQAEAAKWYRKAAEQGNAKAQRNLGVCYEYGRGVGEDPKEAVNWYRKAAEQGNADAQKSLARCYAMGLGVARNRAESLKWGQKAAEQGDTSANNAWEGIANEVSKIIAAEDKVRQYREAAERGTRKRSTLSGRAMQMAMA